MDINEHIQREAKPVPHWRGPRKDGITQSYLNSYIICKERLRLRLIEGLSVPQSFSMPIHYGEMFHQCEEAHGEKRSWEQALLKYSKELLSKYPSQQDQIMKAYNLCLIQYPIYLEYWRQHEPRKIKHLHSELSFALPYRLPSGRWFTMRGKIDGVIQIGDEIFLQENKTKSDIDRDKIIQRLKFDLQTMYYLHALKIFQSRGIIPPLPVVGVYYNVIKRPLSGGKGTIRQHKGTKNKPGETEQEFYLRFRDEVLIPDCGSFFDRFEASLNEGDLNQFQQEFMNPVLENLYDDWQWWSYCKRFSHSPFDYLLRGKVYPMHMDRHYRFPYGVYSGLVDGRATGTDLDYFIDTGNAIGLETNQPLFPEL